MSCQPRLVWYCLFDSSTGQPFLGTTADKVSVSISADVADFRDAVHTKNLSILTGIVASQLLVYKNKADFDKRDSVDQEKEGPLDPTEPISFLGIKDDMIIVSVTPYRGSSPESRLIGKEPNPTRKQRWRELNDILERNSKSARTNDSSAYSSITWNQVKSVFNPTKYVQSRRNIDIAQLKFLSKYLSFTTQCFGDITSGKEAKRRHFIAPILVCVCFLFDGDVTILVEEDLVGTFVKAHGHFEFMLRRGSRAVCIVEAKKDDVEQGMAQNLVGCEVAAEVGGLDIVYGIVTSYIQWNFFCSLNDKVKKEECSLRLTPDGPELESLKEIAEKIYSMLSNDEFTAQKDS